MPKTALESRPETAAAVKDALVDTAGKPRMISIGPHQRREEALALWRDTRAGGVSAPGERRRAAAPLTGAPVEQTRRLGTPCLDKRLCGDSHAPSYRGGVLDPIVAICAFRWHHHGGPAGAKRQSPLD